MNAEVFKIIGEAVGVIATCEGFFIYFSPTREKILIFKFISDALWFINLLCLGGYTGALLNIVAMGRETVFYNRDRYEICKNRLWLPFFMVATAASPLISLLSGKEGLYALLAAAGSMLGVIAFYQRDPNITRAVGFFAQLLWLGYAIFIRNYSSAVCNSVLIISAVVGTFRALYHRKK